LPRERKARPAPGGTNRQPTEKTLRLRWSLQGVVARTLATPAHQAEVRTRSLPQLITAASAVTSYHLARQSPLQRGLQSQHSSELEEVSSLAICQSCFYASPCPVQEAVPDERTPLRVLRDRPSAGDSKNCGGHKSSPSWAPFDLVIHLACSMPCPSCSYGVGVPGSLNARFLAG
jgi:hypothetical protein